MGQVWGWGYGGEGQLGLGSRIKMVASPHLIPCIDPSSSGEDSSAISNQESVGATAEQRKSIGNRIKGIACGGRHSAVVTGRYRKFIHAVITLQKLYFFVIFCFSLSDTGVLLAFGWGLYGQVTPCNVHFCSWNLLVMKQSVMLFPYNRAEF